MAKGHEPKGMTSATGYGQESSMPGRAMVPKKTHKSAKRHGKRNTGKRT